MLRKGVEKTFHKFVINCMLRVWTPGSSFKRSEVLPVTFRFGMEDKQLIPPHLVGSTKAKIETFSLLNISCDIFMNSCGYPLRCLALFWPYRLNSSVYNLKYLSLTCCSQIQHPGSSETLMQNSCAVQ